MAVFDQTGREIKEGQIVHIRLSGMYNGHVVDVRENAIATPGRPPQPAMVEVHVVMYVPVDRGIAQATYVVQEAPPEEKKVDIVH